MCLNEWDLPLDDWMNELNKKMRVPNYRKLDMLNEKIIHILITEHIDTLNQIITHTSNLTFFGYLSLWSSSGVLWVGSHYVTLFLELDTVLLELDWWRYKTVWYMIGFGEIWILICSLIYCSGCFRNTLWSRKWNNSSSQPISDRLV